LEARSGCPQPEASAEIRAPGRAEASAPSTAFAHVPAIPEVLAQSTPSGSREAEHAQVDPQQRKLA
jgi:hypothetical protein